MTEVSEYFTSPEHEARMKFAIERERAKVHATTERDGILAGMSDAIGAMTFYISFFRSVGLKNVAIKILKMALEQTRKGT